MYCFDDHVNRAVHVALVKGDLSATDNPLVRVHLQDTLGDVIGVQNESLGWPLDRAIERIAEEDVGVIVLLRDQESSRDFMDAVDGLGTPHDDLLEHRSGDAVLRTYGIGAQILRDLGLSQNPCIISTQTHVRDFRFRSRDHRVRLRPQTAHGQNKNNGRRSDGA